VIAHFREGPLALAWKKKKDKRALYLTIEAKGSGGSIGSRANCKGRRRSRHVTMRASANHKRNCME